MDEAAEGRYNIKAVTRMTGLSADTIRAWERRYGVVAPARTAGRHRLYSARDVERLRLLSAALADGHAIGRVAALPDDDLRRLGAAARPAPGPSGAAHVDVVAALRRFDAVAAEHELRRLAAVLPPRQLVFEVVLPLLAAIGDGWAAGKVGIAHEHLGTTLVRGLLGSLLGVLAGPREGAPLVLATLPGDLHELGLLCLALLARAHGHSVVLLGAQVPVADLLEAARAARARGVCLGLAIADDPPRQLAQLEALATDLPAGQLLWLGGAGAAMLPSERLPARCRVFAALDEADRALAALAEGA